MFLFNKGLLQFCLMEIQEQSGTQFVPIWMPMIYWKECRHNAINKLLIRNFIIRRTSFAVQHHIPFVSCLAIFLIRDQKIQTCNVVYQFSIKFSCEWFQIFLKVVRVFQFSRLIDSSLYCVTLWLYTDKILVICIQFTKKKNWQYTFVYMDSFKVFCIQYRVGHSPFSSLIEIFNDDMNDV